MRRATPSATSARPWWSSAAWSERPTASSLDLPHSDGCFVKAYPAETTEAFLDGHVSAFAFLGGVPQSILYDNTKLAVAKILGDGRRKAHPRLHRAPVSLPVRGPVPAVPARAMTKARWRAWWGMCAETSWCRCRPLRALMRSMPTWNNDAWSEWTPSSGDIRRPSAIGWSGDLDALLPLPPVAYDACEKQAGRVSSLSLVRYRTNDYSVPVAYGYRDVLVRGYVDEVVISCGSEVIARHPRSYDRDDFVYDPVHYLPLLERKPGALDQAAPLRGWELPAEFGTLRRLLESRMGRRGKREYVQVLRLLETFSQQEVAAAAKDAIRLGGW